MVVIGVTGTNGKSSVVNFISQLLEMAGHSVGFTSTVNFKIGKKEWLNNIKMTMPGRFQLQKLLRQMADAGCEYAIIETSSEGIKQWRHFGINYDVAVFTNLTPEHIESHGGFENYKRAKGELFKHLTEKPRKTIKGEKIPKQIIVNADDEHAEYFLEFKADKKYGFTFQPPFNGMGLEYLHIDDVKLKEEGSEFKINNNVIRLPLFGEFNIQNAVAAFAAARALGVPFEKAISYLEKIQAVPGRLEFINAGQPFDVIIDYAPEPASMRVLIKFLEQYKSARRIHVLGSCGGGRDIARRPVLGKLAADYADIVIVTNEDPYDEDPQEIIDQVAMGALGAGKKEGETLFRILDRREAIRKALSLAKPNNMVVITGKGAEQAMCAANGKKIPWDDRSVVREELIKMGYVGK